MKSLLSGLCGVFVLLLLCNGALASGLCIAPDSYGFVYTVSSNSFQSIQYPGASRFTRINGINDLGQIVGTYADNIEHGFWGDGGTLTTIQYPGATFTELTDINNAGQIVGTYSVPSNGAFLKSGNTFTSVSYSGAQSTIPDGINNNGEIVGGYLAANNQEHGFVGGVNTLGSFDVPGARYTRGYGINDFISPEIADIHVCKVIGMDAQSIGRTELPHFRIGKVVSANKQFKNN